MSNTNVWEKNLPADAQVAAALRLSADLINSNVTSLSAKTVRGVCAGIESLDASELDELARSAEHVSAGIESFCATNTGLKLSAAQTKSAQIALAAASDFNAAARAELNIDGSITGRPGIENFDERDPRVGQLFTVAYNMLAPRQEEAAELFFPTCVQPAETNGFAVTIQLINLVEDYRRQPGDVPKENIGRKQLLKAYIDPTLIKNDLTRGFPIFRAGQTEKFLADQTLIPARDIVYEGEEHKTAPLRPKVNVDLIALSQTDALLATGSAGYTDVLDRHLALTTAYFAIDNKAGDGKEVFKFAHLENNQSAVLTSRPQGDALDMIAPFTASHLILNKESVTIAGAPITGLEDIVTSDLRVHVRMKMNVEANLQSAQANASLGLIEVSRIEDADGVVLSLENGVGKAIADKIAGAELAGYDLIFRRLNSNLRQRGQLLETTHRTQMYTVPLLSPLTCLRPLAQGDNRDASDLQALLAATRLRCSIAAIDKLLETDETMFAAGIKNGTVSHDDTGIGGVARHLVNAHYVRETFDVKEKLMTLQSSDRLGDLYALFVNKLREMAYVAHRDTGFKLAKDALSGTVTDLPEVIIVTDPVIARFIMVTGDFRTLGNEFKVTVKSTWNNRMAGKLFMTFGDSAGAPEGVPNPMHFGLMAWRPEQSLVLPLHRGGANSKELSVSPSFLHIVNMPILMRLDVLNLTDALVDKLAFTATVKP